MALVTFNRKYSQATFDSLPIKDDDTLYFIRDSKRLYLGNYLFAIGNLRFSDTADGWAVDFDNGQSFRYTDNLYQIDTDDTYLTVNDNSYRSHVKTELPLEANIWTPIYDKASYEGSNGTPESLYENINLYIDITTAGYKLLDVNLMFDESDTYQIGKKLRSGLGYDTVSTGIYSLNISKYKDEMMARDWVILAKYDTNYGTIKETKLESGTKGGFHVNLSFNYSEENNRLDIIGKDGLIVDSLSFNNTVSDGITLLGDGTEANPITLGKVFASAGLSGTGTEIDPLELNLLTDNSLSGDGKFTPLSVSVVTTDLLTGKGTDAEPLSVKRETDGSIIGIGEGDDPLRVHIESSDSFSGTGATEDPLQLRIQSDGSLEGYGEDLQPLSVNIQHDESLEGKGSVADPLKVSVKATMGDGQTPSILDVRSLVGYKDGDTLLAAYQNNGSVEVLGGNLKLYINDDGGATLSFVNPENTKLHNIKVDNLDLSELIDDDSIQIRDGKLFTTTILEWD